MNSVPNMGYSARTLQHLYTELTKELSDPVEGDPGGPVEIGPRVLEGSLAAGHKEKPLRSMCFYKKVVLGKFSRVS